VPVVDPIGVIAVDGQAHLRTAGAVPAGGG